MIFLRTSKPFSILLHFLLGCCLLSSCQDEPEEDQAVDVVTAPVTKMAHKFTSTYPASVVALEEVELRADVTGYITLVNVQEGQKVKKGTLLYTIDQTRYQARREQAEAALAIAEANLERFQRDINRYEKLKAEDAIADQIYDNALVDLRNAEQQVNSAQSDLDNALIDLDYARIRAPFDGTVGFSQVRIGTLVRPGETLLNTISQDDPIAVDFFPEERHLGRFQTLASSNEVEQDSVFNLRLPGGERYPFVGKIFAIDRAVDRNTGTFRVRIQFPNPDNVLRPGLSTIIEVKDDSPEEVLVVPQAAVQEQMGEFSVFVVEGDSVKQVKIVPGRTFSANRVVQEGLSENQEIVIKGMQKLNSGDVIRRVEEEEENTP